MDVDFYLEDIMTTLFTSLLKCISTLLQTNYHYSQHQSVMDHSYSLAPMFSLEQSDDGRSL